MFASFSVVKSFPHFLRKTKTLFSRESLRPLTYHIKFGMHFRWAKIFLLTFSTLIHLLVFGIFVFDTMKANDINTLFFHRCRSQAMWLQRVWSSMQTPRMANCPWKVVVQQHMDYLQVTFFLLNSRLSPSICFLNFGIHPSQFVFGALDGKSFPTKKLCRSGSMPYTFSIKKRRIGVSSPISPHFPF